jgi:signal transduction histidine kinase
MFAFYPWTGFREPAKRRTIEAGLILAVVVHPIVIVGLMTRWHFTAGHVRSFAVYAVWAVVWFSVGKGISWLFRIAVQGETEALTASYDATVGDLHTYVDNAVLAIESGDDPHEVAVRLRVHIAERRKELTKVEDHVAAVSIFENAIRAYAGRLELRSTPEVGTFTIPREHAILVDHGLSDLLKNVVVHGEGVAELDLVVRDGVMILDVRDFGPGLARDQFDEPDTSLQRLRRRLHRHGGDLQLRHPGGSGAAVRLSLPVRPRR